MGEYDPADPDSVLPLLEQVANLLEGEGSERVAMDPTGSEPFVSIDLGDGYVVDLSAQLRKA